MAVSMYLSTHSKSMSVLVPGRYLDRSCIETARWMRMPLKAQGSFICKDQVAVHDNNMGERRKMMSLVIRKVNMEQIFTISCNTRSVKCSRTDESG